MAGTNGLKETTLSVSVFTARGKVIGGDFDLRRVRRGAGGRNDEVADAEALTNWIALYKLRFRK
jgi:hypothetical protein